MRNRRTAVLGTFFAAAALALALPTPTASAAEAQGEIVIIGGAAVVSEQLESHLASCTTLPVQRIAGSDRYATAGSIAAHWPSADTVFVATGLNFPDAISAGPAAASADAPILLTKPTSLPAATRSEIQRLSPSRVVLLGETAAISQATADEIATLTTEVVRLGGIDRYDTAAIVSAWAFPSGSDVAYVATGTGFRDALVAGPRAAADGAPILLVEEDSVPDVTRDELVRLGVDRIVIMGSSGVVGTAVEADLAVYAAGGVSRIAGGSRYTTAAAAAIGAPGSRVFVVTGDSFADGLAATPLAGGAPILFVEATELHLPTANTIASRTGSGCEPWALPYPAVGSGKRIIYSNSEQQVWLIDEDENLVDTYLVSGRRWIPYAGTYSVFSKSVNAWAPYGGITMKHMVRFVRPNTWGNKWSYGFHSIPRYSNGTPLQTEAQLGTFRSGGCVRQADHKAVALYNWAPIGTKVIVLP